jgi:hypothetical protein
MKVKSTPETSVASSTPQRMNIVDTRIIIMAQILPEAFAELNTG